MDLTIGFIAPTSQFLPQFNQRIIQAFELGLGGQHKHTVSVVKQAGGLNASPRILKEKIEQMVLEHNIDIIIAPLNIALLDKISDTIDSCKIPFIALTLGEDVSGYECHSPYIWLHSYGQWHSLWLLGQHCATLGYKNLCSIAAYHDSGYASSFAFSLGLEQLNGAVQQYFVEPKAHAGITNGNELNNTDADAVFLSVSGTNQQAFIDPILALNIPVFTNTTAGYNDTLVQACNRVFTCGSWQVNNNSQPNVLFKNTYSDTFNRQPNAYDLLAYEAGLMMKALAKSEHGALTVNARLPQLNTEGPRGPLKFDGQETALNNHYLMSYKAGELEACTVLPTPAELTAHYKKAQQLQKSGWLNPYLIA